MRQTYFFFQEIMSTCSNIGIRPRLFRDARRRVDRHYQKVPPLDLKGLQEYFFIFETPSLNFKIVLSKIRLNPAPFSKYKMRQTP